MGQEGTARMGILQDLDMCLGTRLLRHKGGTWALHMEEWCAHTVGRRVQGLVSETSGWEERGMKGGGRKESCMVSQCHMVEVLYGKTKELGLS